MLLLEDTARAVGRYPNLGTSNNGYLAIQSHNGNTEISDSHLAAQPNWTGGDVVIRKNRWIIDKYPISDHSGGSIKFKVDGYTYEPSDDYGYFIQNHPAALDLYGEWAYRNADKSLLLYTGSINPAGKKIQVSTLDTLVRVHYQSNIVFYNLSFKGSNLFTIDIYYSQGITLSDCEISYSGANSLNVYNTRELKVKNCTIAYSNNDAVLANECFQCRIGETRITQTGIIRGMGANNDDAYQAVVMRGIQDTVEYNQIDSTGYMPIRFEGDSILIKNNYIDYFALVKDDGGGIYTWQAGDDATIHYARKIVGNIVKNGIGDGSGTNQSSFLSANGIYVDGHAGQVDISGNTVSNCSLGGIFLNNPSDIQISDNTVFNTRYQINMSHIFDTYVGRNRLKKNIFFSKYESQNILNLESQYDDIKNFAAFDSNYYCKPSGNNVIIQSTSKRGDKNLLDVYNLPKWQSVQQKDSNTKQAPLSASYYSNVSSYGENKYANGKFDADISGLNAWSPEGYCVAAWKNTDKLDRGALEISFNGLSPTINEAFVVIGIGEVKAGQSYSVKFSTRGTDNNSHVGIFLRQSFGPYGTISDVKYTLLSSQRQDGEWIFTSTIDEKNASLVLSVEEQTSPVYFDNFVVTTANVSVENVDSNILFIDNPSKISKTMTIEGTYVDAKSTLYSGVITLEPYTSAILMKQQASLLPAEDIYLTGTKMPNASKLAWNVDKGLAISHFEIQRSTDAVNFTTMDKIADVPKESIYFNYTDNTPAANRNFYRIKLVTKEGKTILSKIVMVKFNLQSSLKLSPNPATHTVTIMLDGSVNANADRFLVVHSLNGVLVQKIRIAPQELSLQIDLSNFSSGTYVISFFSNNKMLEQKKLIKL